MRKLTILGATGSIGASTLKVIAQNPQQFSIVALVAGVNVAKMYQLCQQWRPKYAVMATASAASELQGLLKNQAMATEVLYGEEAMCQVAALDDVDTVMAAIVGAAGLLPTMAAVKAGKRVLLANKEALVMSGQLFIDAVAQSGAELMPVDSEHNAIFQCLPTEIQTQLGRCDLSQHGIDHILLTGSGGPFRYSDLATLDSVTPEQAIAHPNWSMGRKITIDSSTMVNKGLEVIEAKWLFDVDVDRVQVVVQPQSIIHSMVEYVDGAIIAELGTPDMKLPIQYALYYPERRFLPGDRVDFWTLGKLEFEKPDTDTFYGLELAYEAGRKGGSLPTVFNAANELAVSKFLNREIKYLEITEIIEDCMKAHKNIENPTLEQILETEAATYERINSRR